MKDRVRELLRAMLRSLYASLPKRRCAVIWAWPDYEDSAVALESALQDADVRRVYLLMSHPRSEAPVPLGPKTRRIKKDSASGWLVFLSARYVFFTHRCFMRRFPADVTSVNVWHGMPIKRVGHLLEGDEPIESRHVLATSEMWSEIMARSMTATGGVLTTGLPRNDRLFVDPQHVVDRLGLAGRADLKKLVVWMPTYRRSVRGRLTVDGRPSGNVFELEGVDEAELNRFLAAHGILAVVKPHPMSKFDGVQLESNLWIVDDEWIQAHGVTLYELLGVSDALISDISSVTIDYLILDRPVIHCIPDLDDYRASRGFSVDDLDDVLAGPVVADLAGLLAALVDLGAGEDPGAEQRTRARSLSHLHLDDRSTARLLDAVGLTPVTE